MPPDVVIVIKADNKSAPQFKRVRSQVKGLETQISSAQKATSKWQSQLQQLAPALAAVATGAGALLSKNLIEQVKGFADAASEMEGYRRALTFVEGSAAKASKVLDRFNELAKIPGLSVPLLTKFHSQLKGIGLESSSIETILKGTARAVTTFGGSMIDVREIMVQLSQAFGKQKIEAQDFKSIIGRVPQLPKFAAEVYGVGSSMEDLNNLFKSSGQTLQQFLLPLFQRFETELPGAAVDSFANVVDNLNDAWFRLKSAIGVEILPLLTQLVQKLTEVVEWFANLDKNTRKLIAGAALLVTALTTITTGIGALAVALTGLNALLATTIGVTGFGGLAIALGAVAPYLAAGGVIVAGLYAMNKAFEVSNTGVIKSVETLGKYEKKLEAVKQKALETGQVIHKLSKGDFEGIVNIPGTIDLSGVSPEQFQQDVVDPGKGVVITTDEEKQVTKVTKEELEARAQARASFIAAKFAMDKKATQDEKAEIKARFQASQVFAGLQKTVQQKITSDTIKELQARFQANRAFENARKVIYDKGKEEAKNILQAQTQATLSFENARRSIIKKSGEEEKATRAAQVQATLAFENAKQQVIKQNLDKEKKVRQAQTQAVLALEANALRMRERQIQEFQSRIQPIADVLANLPFSFADSMREIFITLPREAKRTLRELEARTKHMIATIKNDTILNEQQKQEQIVAIQANAAKEKLRIQQKLDRDKAASFKTFVGSFLKGIEQQIRAEYKLLAAKKIVAAATVALNAVANRGGGGASGKKGAIGTIVGTTLGAIIGTIAGAPATGASIGATAGSAVGQLFHFPGPDRTAQLAGRNTAAQTSTQTRNRNAQDFSQFFSQGFLDKMKEQRGIDFGQSGNPVVIENHLDFGDQTIKAVNRQIVHLVSQGRTERG